MIVQFAHHLARMAEFAPNAKRESRRLSGEVPDDYVDEEHAYQTALIPHPALQVGRRSADRVPSLPLDLPVADDRQVHVVGILAVALWGVAR